ncbi:chaperone DnaK [Reticulomyxa filosa]|uniref:Chaperone DnaK n=1 Tax=Reticulomyxa filosa TaxID=46433 RepID=X6M9T4_RETFI|nr:chaperone DnaK [Reticulomyxa filosa]|eukprot:ETO10376.1 chaperone DnaK [Reticulomyxa filosa]
MKEDAEKMRAEDVKRKQSAEEKIVQLEEFKSQIDDDLRKEIQECINNLRDVRNKQNATAEELKGPRDKLNKTLSKIGEKIYGKNQGTQQQQADKTNEQTADADFNEKSKDVRVDHLHFFLNNFENLMKYFFQQKFLLSTFIFSKNSFMFISSYTQHTFLDTV